MNPVKLSKKIADETSVELQSKFAKGQKEHGGDFARKPTVDNIRDEVLDLVNYSYGLKLHKKGILDKIDDIIYLTPSTYLKDVLNDLKKMVEEM